MGGKRRVGMKSSDHQKYISTKTPTNLAVKSVKSVKHLLEIDPQTMPDRPPKLWKL